MTLERIPSGFCVIGWCSKCNEHRRLVGHDVYVGDDKLSFYCAMCFSEKKGEAKND